MSKKAVLIVNTKSRQGRDRFAQARSGLTARGIELTEALAVRDPKESAETRTERGAVRGVTLVVVGGGDGTLSSVVQVFRRDAERVGRPAAWNRKRVCA